MADKDQYDEYQFSDLDTMDDDAPGDEASDPLSEKTEKKQASQKNVRRNAFVVIFLIIFFLLGYKFIGKFFHKGEQSAITSTPPPATMEIQQPPAIMPIQPQTETTAPIETPPPVSEKSSADSLQIKQKLSDLEVSQENVRTEVSSVNSQLGGINANVSHLTEKIATLNQMIATLAAKVEQQSNELTVMTEKARPKPVVHRIHVKKVAQGLTYFIQAVIPGRAWLIATNGSTITVREGSAIPGYGIVKLIDPNQGRVLTSSGQVIRFSQQDS